MVFQLFKQVPRQIIHRLLACNAVVIEEHGHFATGILIQMFCRCNTIVLLEQLIKDCLQSVCSFFEIYQSLLVIEFSIHLNNVGRLLNDFFCPHHRIM